MIRIKGPNNLPALKDPFSATAPHVNLVKNTFLGTLCPGDFDGWTEVSDCLKAFFFNSNFFLNFFYLKFIFIFYSLFLNFVHADCRGKISWNVPGRKIFSAALYICTQYFVEIIQISPYMLDSTGAFNSLRAPPLLFFWHIILKQK